MKHVKKLFIFFVTALSCINTICSTSSHPSVQIAILIRNKAHILPYFFSYLENLEYPKERILLWIRSDHNEDNSLEVIETWLNTTKDLYHTVDYKFDKKETRYESENSTFEFAEDHMNHVITLKEEAMQYAKGMNVDFLFFLDADVLLGESSTLKYLVSLNLPIVSPMLKSDASYSNFWCGMTDNYEYLRTDEYSDILLKQKIGEFKVPLVLAAVLINTKQVNLDLLTFNDSKLKTASENFGEVYDGPDDDLIVFAMSAKYSQTPCYVSNVRNFGYFTNPAHTGQSMDWEVEKLGKMLTWVYDTFGSVNVQESMQKFVRFPSKDRMGFSKIFVINLLRRPVRKTRLESIFKFLGIDAEFFPAIDRYSITTEWIKNQGMKFISNAGGLLDDINMTFGQIGCFMSHYNIWKQMLDENLDMVLIFEDDVDFDSHFKSKTIKVMDEAKNSGMKFDLIWLGRGIRTPDVGRVEDAESFVKPGYTWLAHAYILTFEGAKKLIESKPLEKMCPVDVYLSLMFGQYENEIEQYEKAWKQNFENPNLIAWAIEFRLAYQKIFNVYSNINGDSNFYSDTYTSHDYELDKARDKANKDEL